MLQKLLLTTSLLFSQIFLFAQPCPSPTAITLPPVALCEGNCFVWHGEPLCNDTTVAFFNIPLCQWEVQELIIVPLTTVHIGTQARVSCSNPCVEFKGVTYCATGTYSYAEGCVTTKFDIEFEKDTLVVGSIGKVTCAHPAAIFNGKAYFNPGDYHDENSCTFWKFSVEKDQTNPVFFNLKPACDNGSEFRISFSIKEATPPFRVNGQPIPGNFYESPAMANTTDYTFLVESISTGCESETFGTFDCSLQIDPDPEITSTEAVKIPRRKLEAFTRPRPEMMPDPVPQLVSPNSGLNMIPAAIFEADETEIFSPNALKINGLSPNDRFTLFARDGLISSIKRLEIFDRNGLPVFSRAQFLPNQAEFGWDGFSVGRQVEPGVFVWLAEVVLTDGECRFLTGDLTVLVE